MSVGAGFVSTRRKRGEKESENSVIIRPTNCEMEFYRFYAEYAAKRKSGGGRTRIWAATASPFRKIYPNRTGSPQHVNPRCRLVGGVEQNSLEGCL